MRKLLLLPILSFVLSLPAHAQPCNEAAKLRIAGSEFEIIGVLMQKQDYSQILGEYRKIVNLDFCPENEKPLVQGTWVIADGLRRAGQYSVATQIINEALPKVRLSESKYFLMMAKGKILKDQGKLEEALEIYRKAQEFAPAEPVPEK